MPWFRVDDTFPMHPKVVAAGNAAIGLWVRAGTWSMQQLTDGLIPKHMLPALGAKPRDAQALVVNGLWITTPEGWVFHDWDDYQPSKAETLDKRSKRAEAGRLGGLKSGESRRSKDEANASALLPESFAQAEANANPVPSRPVPTQTPLLTLVCRRLSGGTRDETTDEEVSVWRGLAGGADLEQELMAWLLYNADVDLRNAGASLRGWLKKAAERSANVAAGAACGQCLDGWLGENAKGQPIPCPTCRPSTRLRVVGE